MSPPFNPRFVLGCLVVLMAALAFSVSGTAGTPSLSATEFDPETDHGELANAPSIHDADNGSPPRAEIRDAFETAAADGRYEGTVQNASSTYSFLRDDRYDFVLFEGAFYEFEATVDGESVVIEADERAPESIADELAVTLENASDPAREAIETGEPVEPTGGSVETSIVEDDGTYYLVRPEHGSDTATASLLVIPAALGIGVLTVTLVVGGLWFRRRRTT